MITCNGDFSTYLTFRRSTHWTAIGGWYIHLCMLDAPSYSQQSFQAFSDWLFVPFSLVIVQHVVRFQPRMSLVHLGPLFAVCPAIFQLPTGPCVVVVLGELLDYLIEIVVENHAVKDLKKLAVWQDYVLARIVGGTIFIWFESLMCLKIVKKMLSNVKKLVWQDLYLFDSTGLDSIYSLKVVYVILRYLDNRIEWHSTWRCWSAEDCTVHRATERMQIYFHTTRRRNSSTTNSRVVARNRWPWGKVEPSQTILGRSPSWTTSRRCCWKGP